MKIERIRIRQFGRLVDFDSGTEPLGGLVVILGPNEAGKSTLFQFLTTALYGFSPATRENNPHVPWGSDEASGSIDLVLSDERRASIERRLRSSPSGAIVIEDQTEPLRNQPVPWVEVVPRNVFRQVFAITLAELAGLDSDTWGRIQDRVVGSMGATDLRPARLVADELETEAGRIWRSQRRGNQRLRQAQDEIRALRARREQARARDREIRQLVEERERGTARLHEAREERQKHRLEVDRAQELLPVKRQLERIQELRDEGGDRDELAGLPPDVGGLLTELERSREDLRAGLGQADQAMQESEQRVAEFDDDAARTLHAREQISDLAVRVAMVEEDRLDMDTAQRELEVLAVRARTAGEHLLTRPLDDDARRAVLAVSLDLLRDRVNAQSTTGPAAGAARTASSTRGSVRRWHAAVGILAGTSAVAWGLTIGPSSVTLVGVALLAASAAVLLTLPGEADAGTADTAGPEVTQVPTRGVGGLLERLAVRPDYLSPPGEALLTQFERLQSAVHDWHEREESFRAAALRVEDVERLGRGIAQALDLPETSGARGLVSELKYRMQEAERRRDAADRARHELEGLRRRRDRLQQELTETTSRVERLLERLAPIGGGQRDAAVNTATRRLEAHAQADAIEQELRRTYPDLTEARARVQEAAERGVPWTQDDEALVRSRTRIEALDAEIAQLSERSGAIEREVVHLESAETVDEVDGEGSDLQEQEARLRSEYDRKILMARLIREADRRFREEHQPDLLRRASAYLTRLTAGRYDRLLVDEVGSGDLFQIVGPHLPAPIPLASPVSTGTLEQAYLSVRLAIVDHLDRATERLPLFIDEAFVNWDERRRAQGLDVLAEVTRERQVFAFTCHPELAAALGDRGGRVIRLGREA